MRPLLLFAATVTSLTAQTQTQTQTRNWPRPSSASEAYDYAQDERQAAGKLWSVGDPQARLQVLLAYLDQPLVRDLAQGSRTLGARPLNIYLDLAAAHAQRNEPARAIEYLHKVAATTPDPRIAGLIANSKAYASLKSEPGFADVLQSLRRYESFWDSKELATPYRDVLPDAEKIAGLSTFWSEVKYNFGYPEKLVELQWDSLYLEWIPKVLAARTTADYYDQLTLLCALLGDGHTNVYLPKELDTSKPPLRTQLVEGRVLITEVMSPALAVRGLRAGTEIVKIDGVPVFEYARTLTARQSSSTPQDANCAPSPTPYSAAPRTSRCVCCSVRPMAASRITHWNVVATPTPRRFLHSRGACYLATSPTSA